VVDKPESGVVAVLRRILPYTTVLCVISAIYTGWVLYSRREANREAERAVEQKRAAADRRVLNAIGDRVKILSFYASPAAVRPGERTLVCYGVANARNVAIEPPIDRVWPSIARCIEARPRKNTTYKLTATDENGRSVTQSIEIDVHR